MADTGNVRGDLDTIREADTGNFTQSRVRLLGGHGTHGSADTTLLRAVEVGVLLFLGVVALQKGRRGALFDQNLTAFAHELVKSRHFFSPFFTYSRAFCGSSGQMAALHPASHAMIILQHPGRNVKSIAKKILKKSCNTENFSFLKQNVQILRRFGRQRCILVSPRIE